MKEPKTVEEIVALLDALRLLVPDTEVKYFADDENTGPADLNAVYFPYRHFDDAGVLVLWEKETKWCAYSYSDGRRCPFAHESNTFESALRMGMSTYLLAQDNEEAKKRKMVKESP